MALLMHTTAFLARDASTLCFRTPVVRRLALARLVGPTSSLPLTATRNFTSSRALLAGGDTSSSLKATIKREGQIMKSGLMLLPQEARILFTVATGMGMGGGSGSGSGSGGAGASSAVKTARETRFVSRASLDMVKALPWVPFLALVPGSLLVFLFAATRLPAALPSTFAIARAQVAAPARSEEAAASAEAAARIRSALADAGLGAAPSPDVALSPSLTLLEGVGDEEVRGLARVVVDNSNSSGNGSGTVPTVIPIAAISGALSSSPSSSPSSSSSAAAVRAALALFCDRLAIEDALLADELTLMGANAANAAEAAELVDAARQRLLFLGVVPSPRAGGASSSSSPKLLQSQASAAGALAGWLECRQQFPVVTLLRALAKKSKRA
jgi:hypothetical protein